jgi:hypothetical protein
MSRSGSIPASGEAKIADMNGVKDIDKLAHRLEPFSTRVRTMRLLRFANNRAELYAPEHLSVAVNLSVPVPALAAGIGRP